MDKNPCVDFLFKALLEALPTALAAGDRHGVVDRLSAMQILPLCAQNIEHMLWRVPQDRDLIGPRGKPRALQGLC